MSQSDAFHYVFLEHKKDSEQNFEAVYNDLEVLKKDLMTLFKKGDYFNVYYDLDEKMLTLEQYLEILNLNPYLPDIKNIDNCSTIEQFKQWLSDYELLVDIELKMEG